MGFAEREIAKLVGTEKSFNLLEYYLRISVHLGSAAFTLLRTSEELEEAGPSTIAFAEQLAGYQRNISMKVVMLEPGNRVRISRRNGVEIYDGGGSLDDERMQRIWDERLQESLRSDRFLSREHAEIEVVGPSDLTVRDLGSVNGTIIKADVELPERTAGPPKPPMEPPDERRRHLRLVE